MHSNAKFDVSPLEENGQSGNIDFEEHGHNSCNQQIKDKNEANHKIYLPGELGLDK